MAAGGDKSGPSKESGRKRGAETPPAGAHPTPARTGPEQRPPRPRGARGPTRTAAHPAPAHLVGVLPAPLEVDPLLHVVSSGALEFPPDTCGSWRSSVVRVRDVGSGIVGVGVVASVRSWTISLFSPPSLSPFGVREGEGEGEGEEGAAAQPKQTLIDIEEDRKARADQAAAHSPSQQGLPAAAVPP